MSFGNSYGGGREIHGTVVVLNVYDLSPANESCLYSLGLGVHHSGVEILGQEYSFASGAGIFDSTPKEVPNAKFRESIKMGSFDGGAAEVRSAISDLRQNFGPEDYNLVRKNCNHFANALCWRLLRKSIPGHVNRIADIGTYCACLLPRKMLEDAPVNPNGGGDSGGSGFQVFPANARTMNRGASGAPATSMTTPMFSGSGARLGSSGSDTNATERSGFMSKIISRGNSSSGKSAGGESIAEKREKARSAALARFEQNSSGDSSKRMD